VVVNMAPITLSEEPRIKYRVDFAPDQEMRGRRRALVTEVLQGQKFAYDGSHVVYTAELIQGQEQLEVEVWEPVYVKVRLQAVERQSGALDRDAIVFFCTRLKEAMEHQMDRIRIGSDFYDLNRAIQVPEHKCILAPGLAMTIYVTRAGPLLSVDSMFRHIRTDTVWDLIQQMRRGGHTWDEDINAALSHKVVLLRYGEPRRCVIVDRLRFDLSPMSTFVRQGASVTFADYVVTAYSLEGPIDPNQPMLENVSRTRRGPDGQFLVSHFIPQLCLLTGQTEEMRQDKFRSRELILKTALSPGPRLNAIQSDLSHLLQTDAFAHVLNPWGIAIEPRMLTFTARRLPSPAVHDGRGEVAVNPETESWVVKDQFAVVRGAGESFRQWSVVAYQDNAEVNEILSALSSVAPQLGIQMAPPRVFIAGVANPEAFVQSLERQVLPTSPSFVLVIIPHVVVEPYRRVKRLLAERGIPSQFVVGKTFFKDRLTVATKVAIQMACKAGGAPWWVKLQLTQPTMFVGMDVHHSGDLEHAEGSVAAFVATLDKECSRMYSRTFVVDTRLEEWEPRDPNGVGLKDLVAAAIEAFKRQNNGQPPKHLIVYRDGGSEGQVARITRCEVAHFKAALDEAGIQCTLTVFVVLKRIRTRFFEANQNREYRNPPPGTVIDHCITNPALPEFYLCCQSVNQGSATPTKYQMVYDDSVLTNNSLQMYTYGLAHLFYNWFGTIRVPAPLQYAHCLAKLTGQVLRGQEVAPALWERLHYL